MVAGTIVNTDQTNNLPFSKPNNRFFPFKGAPLVDASTGSGTNPTHKQHGDKKHWQKQGCLFTRSGATPENFLFGRITVIDDEITKGLELGSEAYQ